MKPGTTTLQPPRLPTEEEKAKNPSWMHDYSELSMAYALKKMVADEKAEKQAKQQK